MDKKEFAVGIKKLELSYNQKFDKEKLDYWYEKLRDMNPDVYLRNIDKLSKQLTFLPNIAQIRAESRSNQYINYEQRDYSGVDFNKLFAMPEIENHIPDV